ncbi:MAG TPA: thiamine pyrophosphate-requiring protein [Syntrophorhabdaceae bacterium]|nr:thiamine pyrophosphate-requiring protein [Syntrophorhabdaceae bacterium]
MNGTVSDHLLQRLREWGVSRVYGFPGDGIDGIMGALNRSKKGPVFVQSRHEEGAAFMAAAHAKFTGQVGVCMATSGPGAIHLLNGLYDAKLDHASVVAIVGQQRSVSLGADFQQEVDLLSLFKDVANEYVHMACSPSQITHLVDSAFRIAMADHVVTCLIIPADVQEMDAPSGIPRLHGYTASGVGYEYPLIIPKEKQIDEAARALNRGSKVAILVGAGALGCTEEVMQIAELLGAGVAKALLGKCVLSDDLPYCTGSIGLLGTKPSWNLMMNCDTLFMIGSGFPYSEFLPKPGSAVGIQIDINPRMLNLRYPMTFLLHGDAKATLGEIIPRLKQKTELDWRKSIEDDVGEWWEILHARAMREADPINPQRLFWDLSRKLPDDVILTNDSGSSTNWFARDIKVKPTMKSSLSGGLATMCPAVPYAIAAKFAYPDRPVVAITGDGAAQMLGMAEMITVAKYYKTWNDPRLIIIVVNNQDLNQVTWEQRVLAGDPKFIASQEIPDVRFADYARLLGLEGVDLTSPKDIDQALDQAFASRIPFVINAYCDPEVPPLPPHITFEQAKNFLSAIYHGDEGGLHLIKTSVAQMMGSWLPHE